MKTAEMLRQEIGSAVAWSMPVYFRARTKRRTRNQFGTTYRFEDGSRVFIPRGTSLIRTFED